MCLHKVAPYVLIATCVGAPDYATITHARAHAREYTLPDMHTQAMST